MEEYLSAWEKKYSLSERVWGGFFCIDDIVNMIRKDALILDVGSGNGKVLVPVAKAGYRVVGLEISRNANKRLKKYLESIGLENVDVLDGDLRFLPFSDCRFDAVTAYHVIGHMPKE
ncbi:MAG: class I SAM-dependent methyltransferase, partial [Thermoplasmata archaeon]